MAIKIYEKFAPRANPADGDYPYGSIKNESVPGAKDGTPLDAVWANDYAGTDAELFAQAGIVPNGQPDKLGASQRVEAINKLIYNGHSYLSAESYAGESKRVWMYGRNSIGDGGEGFFNVLPTTKPERIGMSISDSEGRTLARTQSRDLSLSWFGDTSDAATAFENAFAYISSLGDNGLEEDGQFINKITINLDGLTWRTSRPIAPTQYTSGLTVRNGHIKANVDFVGDFLYDIDDPVGLRVHHYHLYDDLVLDGSFVTSCMRMNRYLRMGISNTAFVQWKANGHGLLVGSFWNLGSARSEGHELIFGGNVTFTQYSFNKHFAGAISSGTALEVNTADGQYSGFVIANAGRGIVVNRTLNRFQNFHIYGLAEKDYGMYFATAMNGIYSQVINGYFDGVSFRALNPNYIEINHSTFLTTSTPIVFESNFAGNTLGEGVIVSNNIYNSAAPDLFKEITLVGVGGGTWLGSGNIMQHYGCQYFTFGSSDRWPDHVKTSAGSVYVNNASGVTTVDLKQWFKQIGGNNRSNPVATLQVISNWQSSSSSIFGIYNVAVMRSARNSGEFVAKVVGFEGSGLQTGFVSAPTVSADGVMTITPSEFYRVRIVRMDNQNFF